MNKPIILYYSYDGNTEKLANSLASNYDLKCVKLEPKKDLDKKGFSKYVWGGFQVISKKRPEIKPIDINLDDFDNIILASPIWAWEIAPTIYSFVEKHDLKNKTISLFYTHQGGHKDAIEKFKKTTNLNLFSTFDCLNVHKDYENQKEKLLNWFKSNFIN